MNKWIGILLMILGNTLHGMEPPICKESLRQVKIFPSKEAEMFYLDIQNYKSDLNFRNYSMVIGDSTFTSIAFTVVTVYSKCPGKTDRDSIDVFEGCKIGRLSKQIVGLNPNFISAIIKSVSSKNEQVANDLCKIIAH